MGASSAGISAATRYGATPMPKSVARWLVDGRLYLYALTSGEAQLRAGRFLWLARAAWRTLTVEAAGRYDRARNAIEEGP